MAPQIGLRSAGSASSQLIPSSVSFYGPRIGNINCMWRLEKEEEKFREERANGSINFHPNFCHHPSIGYRILLSHRELHTRTVDQIEARPETEEPEMKRTQGGNCDRNYPANCHLKSVTDWLTDWLLVGTFIVAHRRRVNKQSHAKCGNVWLLI